MPPPLDLPLRSSRNHWHNPLTLLLEKHHPSHFYHLESHFRHILHFLHLEGQAPFQDMKTKNLAVLKTPGISKDYFAIRGSVRGYIQTHARVFTTDDSMLCSVDVIISPFISATKGPQ